MNIEELTNKNLLYLRKLIEYVLEGKVEHLREAKTISILLEQTIRVRGVEDD